MQVLFRPCFPVGAVCALREFLFPRRRYHANYPSHYDHERVRFVGQRGHTVNVGLAAGTARVLPPPVCSLPTNFLPLGVVLLFDGVVTAREDYTRHVDDRKANTSKGAALVLGCACICLSNSLNPFHLERSACDVAKRGVYRKAVEGHPRRRHHQSAAACWLRSR
jgi:hypothetical protein